jgi:hypothetical protein
MIPYNEGNGLPIDISPGHLPLVVRIIVQILQERNHQRCTDLNPAVHSPVEVGRQLNQYRPGCQLLPTHYR